MNIQFDSRDDEWFDEGELIEQGRSAACYEREIRELKAAQARLVDAAQYAQTWLGLVDRAESEDEALDLAFGPAKHTALRQLSEALAGVP
jgi:hypothetical protein